MPRLNLWSLICVSCLVSLNVARVWADVSIVLLAGTPSHGYGSHEHLAGCRILAQSIESHSEGVNCSVVANGWPEDESILDSADAIVMYCDGGGGHPALRHLEKLGQLMERGVGFTCLHYAVEVPKEAAGEEFLSWLGGYFETHWSVNPHWTADFKELPQHAVTHGVEPFSANDEWYFHMRFQPEMKGVTPILSAIAPLETMTRPDGPHSGNPDVRKTVEQGLPQHVAWVYERGNGGRSFGFTGGHYHWNWGREPILRLVTNAIVWTAKKEVPTDGLDVQPPTAQALSEGQDEPKPGNFDAMRIAEEFKLSSKPAAEGTLASGDSSKGATSRLVFKSEVLHGRGPKRLLTGEAEIDGARKVFLVVNDAGDGFTCDWAAWVEPKLTYTDGKEEDLTELKWKTATTSWGNVAVGKNPQGGTVTVDGRNIQKAIGTHANSIIEYELPEGVQKLKFSCALDDGGSGQPSGDQASIQFQVFVNAAPNTLNFGDSGGEPSIRDPENAESGLTVHEGVAATLAASEPRLLSLTNLDIDHRGRIWVCEVVNYRGHNGERPEGDRILILEDTDHDGKIDTSKVFYQGRDVDSALGICVLGNKVIVSASPNVLVFTDDDGDDVFDRKELFFTKTGQPQHDHSAHTFLFGPDGKLYWNFGNTGKGAYDSQGEPVIDIHGHPVVDNGKPYFGGMAFRCNLDGSEFEVLGHNFRNNYELAVDSFGTVWQSDNDDDGNRGTRINFVMEYGNYGYLDELTGAGWREARTNMEDTIPEQHWHLNDPGVVPSLLLTGAGSPTGITVYEGTLLPEVFHNQVIHCDAGPNVVRAYPVTESGAGYSATIENLVVGERDRWFRPADVCVAPDGSLFITDWYDPGVGGHQMGDTERGRLFRVAPPGEQYSVPKFDFETAEGAVEALRNPNNSVRYMAWKSIQQLGAKAKPALETMAQDADPRMRARALWAIGKLPDSGNMAVAAALADSDPNVRVMGIRLARQLHLETRDIVAKVLSDASPQVRRELVLSLRYDKSVQMPAMWAVLASSYDGQDRWYLEALGIGAELRWAECFDEYLELMKSKQQPPSRDIIWRARAPRSAEMIVELLCEPDIGKKEALRMLRSLEFHSKETQQTSYSQMLVSLNEQPVNPLRDWLIVEALLRSDNSGSLIARQEYVATVERFLNSASRDEQLRALAKMDSSKFADRLIGIMNHDQVDSTSVGACELLVSGEGRMQLQKALHSDDATLVAKLGEVIGSARSNYAQEFQEALFEDATTPESVAIPIAKGMAATNRGARRLIAAARSGTMMPGIRLVAGSLLRTNPNPELRAAAEELFPLPITKSKTPIPPMQELVKRVGNAARGQEIFRTTGTCANCHVLNSVGKNVGPDLSEIGSKLAREALYVSILDPSAGISHNYESYAALSEDGQVTVGLLVSQTDNEITLKDAQGIERKFVKADLEQLKKLETSLMPANIIEAMSVEDLVDVVEYLTTLQKK